MTNYKAKLKTDITLFQLIELFRFLIKYLNIEINQTTYDKLPSAIKKHFEKIT